MNLHGSRGVRENMAEIHWLEDEYPPDSILSRLCQPVRDWFEWRFPSFTSPQLMAIPHLIEGEHLLLCSPTGTGKTMTAFLSIIDQLVRKAMDRTLEDKVHCVYISPIKALANDIQKNLIQPLEEIKNRFLPRRALPIKVALRTGDTSQSERQKMLRSPPHILITTPESLSLAIASPKFSAILSQTEHLIIDELHSLIPTKRGTLLALTVARLDQQITTNLQRIGISATMEPLEEVARFLVHSDVREKEGVDQIVNIARLSLARSLDLDILLPHRNFIGQAVKDLLDHSIEIIKDLVEAHTTTLVFANTRRMTETVLQKLRLLGVEGVEAHHGSMDKKVRLDVERRMKAGELRAVVTSSSLEMGIDIGSVDLVVQIGSTGQIGTALQRIGRAGHHVGGVPRARLIPISPDDLVEMVALHMAILSGDMDLLHIPTNCLDVLSQFLVGLTVVEEMDMDEAHELVRSTYPYRDLAWDSFIDVLDLLEEERRIWIDYEDNTFGRRGYSRMIYYTNVGTIAADSSYLVFDSDGSVIGHLSSSFVQSLRNGDVFLLGGQTYRVHAILPTRVNVTPITGHRPTVPSWSGEARSRSRELGRWYLELIDGILGNLVDGGNPTKKLTSQLGINRAIASSLVEHLGGHVATSHDWPSLERITIEQVRGPTQLYLIATGRGRRFNLAFAHFLGGLCRKHEIGVLEVSSDDNGLMLRLSDELDPAAIPAAVAGEDWESLFEAAVQDTQLFRRRFSEVCCRSLITPRRIGAEEVSPKRLQRDIAAVLERQRQEPDSVLINETLNEIFQIDIDRKELREFFERLGRDEVEIIHAVVKVPSTITMGLFASAFEDLLAMRTRAYLIKDLDPEIVASLIGQRTMATELTEEQVRSYYEGKSPTPKDAQGLLMLMHKGGGLTSDLSHPLYDAKLAKVDKSTIKGWIQELIEMEAITKIRGTNSTVDDKWFSHSMAHIHGTLGILHDTETEDLHEVRTSGVTFEVATEFKGIEPTKWKEVLIGEPYEALRRKIIEVLGTEGPQTMDALNDRLPFSDTILSSVLNGLEVRNRISIGFFTQIDEPEYILRIDEHRLSGGDHDVIEARDVQNLIMQKSFAAHQDAYAAVRAQLYVQKPLELLPRVKGFRFGDWMDLLYDDAVIMGRLMQNRVGYTTLDQIPLLLGLRQIPGLTDREAEVLGHIREGEFPTRAEILSHFPKDEEHRHIMREAKNALSNLERNMAVVKQFEEVEGRRRRLTVYRRVTEQPMDLENALLQLIDRLGPMQINALRLYVGYGPESIGLAIKTLVERGDLVKIRALKPDPVTFYCSMRDATRLSAPLEEDRTLRILTQSDPFVSRFVHEVRYVLKRGWYHPVLKGVDPIGKVFMYRVNDYHEVKDVQIPLAYIEEFCQAFAELLDNYSDQNIDVAVLTQINGLGIDEFDEDLLEMFGKIGFTRSGERLIRGGIIQPRAMAEANRVLFEQHNLHQSSRFEHESLAIKSSNGVRDDFALRGRCHMYRMDLKAMSSANRLHQGVNLHGHQVRANYDYFQRLLTIRGGDLPEETSSIQIEALEYFGEASDPQQFMDRHALRRSEFRKIIQPMIRTGHLVQDDRNGFSTVDPLSVQTRGELRRAHLLEILGRLPVVTMRQFSRLASKIFRAAELKSALQEGIEEGIFIKGFLLQDVHEVCWGRPELLDRAAELPQMRDFVLPPSDYLTPYFSDILRQQFGFGSAYLVFKDEEPVAAFKANTRNNIIDITDYVGEEKGIRVIKEFAWEHQLPIEWSTRVALAQR